jgi:hypothetical protein
MAHSEWLIRMVVGTYCERLFSFGFTFLDTFLGDLPP